MDVCGACGSRISDRYIMRVGEVSYHERCLACSSCGLPLSHTCYSRESKLLCRIDYERLYVKKCLSCGEPVGPSELVMRAVDSVFHLRCFLCVVCGVRLQKGDQYVVKQGQLFCRPDYEKEVEMFQGYAQSEGGCGEETGSTRSTDGRRGPKRPRTILTTQQRRAFKASFELSPKPCRKVRETLAKDTGLSVRIVQYTLAEVTQGQASSRMYLVFSPRLVPSRLALGALGLEAVPQHVSKEAREEVGGLARVYTVLSGDPVHACLSPCRVWFQNQRAKIKKMQKKHRLDPKNNNKEMDIEEKPEKIKDEDHSPPGGGGGYLNDSCSDTEGLAPDFTRVKEEQDREEGSFYRSMMAGHQIPPPHTFTTLENGKLEAGFGYTPGYESYFLQHGLNPIDRLYSMQSSYFCAEESQPMDQ